MAQQLPRVTARFWDYSGNTASAEINTDPVIQSVVLLEGSTEITDAEVIQYVNLKRDNEFVDGTDIKHIDRLGRALRIKVTFTSEGPHPFNIKLKPDPNNTSYSPVELTKDNGVFKYTATSDPLSGSVMTNYTIVTHNDKILLSPSGNDLFTVVAVDMHGNEVEATTKIRTRRKLYYVETKMRGITPVPATLNTFAGEYDKYFIQFSKLPEVLEISHDANIDKAARDGLKSRVTSRYNSSTSKNKDPYCVAVVFVEHLANKKMQELKYRVTVTATSTSIRLNLPSGKDLWDPRIDSSNWFVEGYFDQTYIFGFFGNKTNIPSSSCTPVAGAGGWCNAIDVDISNLPEGSGELVLKVNLIDGMSGGVSLGDTNIVAIGTKSWGTAISDADQSCILIHEVGHQLNMACNGSDKLPDRVPTFYTGKGHTGRHCNSGLNSRQKALATYGRAELTSSTCVMYGQSKSTIVFCANCGSALKKLNLGNGFQ